MQANSVANRRRGAAPTLADLRQKILPCRNKFQRLCLRNWRHGIDPTTRPNLTPNGTNQHGGQLHLSSADTAASFAMVYTTSYHALKQRANLQTGETLLVLATDPGSPDDFVAFAESTGNTLLKQDQDDVGVFRFVLRREV